MQRVHQRVVDDLDVRVVDHVLVRVVHLRHAALGGEGLRAATVPGRDRDQLVAENFRGIHDAVIGDPGRTQDPDPQRGRHGPTSTAEPVAAARTIASSRTF